MIDMYVLGWAFSLPSAIGVIFWLFKRRHELHNIYKEAKDKGMQIKKKLVRARYKIYKKWTKYFYLEAKYLFRSIILKDLKAGNALLIKIKALMDETTGD